MKNAPSRDTIILWSAVIAGIGLLALLVRHAAIYKFGTDTFTGNVLSNNPNEHPYEVIDMMETV